MGLLGLTTKAHAARISSLRFKHDLLYLLPRDKLIVSANFKFLQLGLVDVPIFKIIEVTSTHICVLHTYPLPEDFQIGFCGVKSENDLEYNLPWDTFQVRWYAFREDWIV